MLDWIFGDDRLIGAWRSDAERTVAELRRDPDIETQHKDKLATLFGFLELRYTRWRCISSSDGRTKSIRYRVVAKDSTSVVIVSSEIVSGPTLPPHRIRSIEHIHFEGNDWYWLRLGSSNLREFFRRLPA